MVQPLYHRSAIFRQGHHCLSSSVYRHVRGGERRRVNDHRLMMPNNHWTTDSQAQLINIRLHEIWGFCFGLLGYDLYTVAGDYQHFKENIFLQDVGKHLQDYMAFSSYVLFRRGEMYKNILRTTLGFHCLWLFFWCQFLWVDILG